MIRYFAVLSAILFSFGIAAMEKAVSLKTELSFYNHDILDELTAGNLLSGDGTGSEISPLPEVIISPSFSLFFTKSFGISSNINYQAGFETVKKWDGSEQILSDSRMDNRFTDSIQTRTRTNNIQADLLFNFRPLSNLTIAPGFKYIDDHRNGILEGKADGETYDYNIDTNLMGIGVGTSISFNLPLKNNWFYIFSISSSLLYAGAVIELSPGKQPEGSSAQYIQKASDNFMISSNMKNSVAYYFTQYKMLWEAGIRITNYRYLYDSNNTANLLTQKYDSGFYGAFSFVTGVTKML